MHGARQPLRTNVYVTRVPCYRCCCPLEVRQATEEHPEKFGPLLAFFDACERASVLDDAVTGKSSLASCFLYCQPELHCLSLACDRCHRLHVHRPRLWVPTIALQTLQLRTFQRVLGFLRPRLSRVQTAPPAGIPVDRSSRVQLTEHPEKLGPLLPCFDTVFRKSKCAERRRDRIKFACFLLLLLPT